MIIRLDNIRIRIAFIPFYVWESPFFGIDIFMSGFEHMFEHMFVPPMQRQCNLIRCRSPGDAETIHDVHKPRGTIRAVFSCRAGSMYGQTGNVSLIACKCVLAMKFFPCFGVLQ